MNFVVVNAAPKVSRTFYEGTYNPEDKAAPPACWSADGDRPDPSVETPQHKNCADCPQNIKGSGLNNSRACRFSQRIAVVLENDLGGDVFQLSLPATSIFGDGDNGKLPLNAYVKLLAGFNVPVTAVVTEARFDVNADTPKLTFKAVRPLTEEEFDLCQKAGQSAAAKQAITFTVSQQDAVKPAQLAAPESKPESKPKPPVQEGDEPKKRESKAPAPTPEPKKSAAALVDEWDD